MSDLKASASSHDEMDGLDESAVGVPAPNTASGFTRDYSLPTVVPKRIHPLAAMALMVAALIPILAMPQAHKVIRKLQHDGGRGRGVAQAAIVIGYLNILLFALVGLNVAVAALLHSAT